VTFTEITPATPFIPITQTQAKKSLQTPAGKFKHLVLDANIRRKSLFFPPSFTLAAQPKPSLQPAKLLLGYSDNTTPR